MILKDGFLCSSYSQIDLYERCPYQWWLKYVQQSQSNIASKHLGYGLAIHETLELFFKMHCNGELPPYDVMVSMYYHFLNVHSIPYDSYEEEMEWTMEGLLMLERLYNPKNELEKLMTTAKIIGVEKSFVVPLHGVNIIGFIDLVLKTYDGIIVVDHKSGKKMFDKSKLNDNLQFPIYAMAIKNEYGELPVKNYYNFTKVHNLQEASVTEQKIKEAELRISKIFKKMSKKKHTPKPCALCYWCDFSKYKMNICTYSSDWKPKSA